MASTLVDIDGLMKEYTFLQGKERYIYKLTAEKAIPYYKPGGKTSKLLFDLKEVENFFRSKRVATRDERRSKIITEIEVQKRKTK